MNKLDKQYTDLLQTILDYGVDKQDRTGTGTKSIFGYTIRHNMKDGFPLLTTKKMYMKGVITELLWFLRGDTNIKYLVDNDCHIWDGDCYQAYLKNWKPENPLEELDDPYRLISGTNLVDERALPKDMFIHCIKKDDEFAKKWGDLGPVYGKQWRRWTKKKMYFSTDGSYENIYEEADQTVIDQISCLINELKTNPDSRRLMVNAWNVGELDSMVLPPCHYGFQVYTRELSDEERARLMDKIYGIKKPEDRLMPWLKNDIDDANVPTRAISLMWNQRSVDTFLGLPFNIASYGLLLEIIAKVVNMVPDELIGNLGDTHLYSNHIEQAKEQIGRELRVDERVCMCYENPNLDLSKLQEGMSDEEFTKVCDEFKIPRRTRTPFELPTLKIENEVKWTEGDCLPTYSITDFTIENYQSHPTIKAPLSN
jgi:thymidylate synthase